MPVSTIGITCALVFMRLKATICFQNIHTASSAVQKCHEWKMNPAELYRTKQKAIQQTEPRDTFKPMKEWKQVLNRISGNLSTNHLT